MNFKKIQEKYPKALAAWNSRKNIGLVECVVRGDYHELECFFDSCDIVIEIQPISFKGWRFEWSLNRIDIKNEDVIKIGMDSEGLSETRTEAKEAAFEKAFEILEVHLNKTP